MAHRGHETPMDFEWQTSGPADHTSPFYLLSQRHRQEQAAKEQAAKEPRAKFDALSIFESPSRRPAPNPAAHQNFFAQTPTSKSAPQFRTPSFTTPRNYDTPNLDSSPLDQPSPPSIADADRTPEHVLQPLPNGSHATTPVERRAPVFGRYGVLTSPGRGEIRRGKYSDTVGVRRVHKRRRQDAEKELRLIHRRSRSSRSSSETEDTDDEKRKRARYSASTTTPQQPPTGILPSLFNYLELHAGLPHVLSNYVQFFVKLGLATLGLFFIYLVWQDVAENSEEAQAEIQAEMAVCAQDYLVNRCARSTRAPAMEGLCVQWEKCMHKNPAAVRIGRLAVRTLADLYDTFLERLSTTNKIFTFSIIVVVAKFTFGRSRPLAGQTDHLAAQHHQQQQQHNYQPPQHQQNLMGAPTQQLTRHTDYAAPRHKRDQYHNASHELNQNLA
ncbi:MAG: hypothetical protein M1825_000781 [Sarcosagium campestre]|nr:MAG: hypothetical protein M1825_000781 [Sarcosagium campestre]